MTLPPPGNPAAAAQPWIASALERHEGPLVRYARRLTGDLEVARDIVQDCFLRLCRQPRDKVGDRVAPWLFAVCRNRAIDHLRKDGRMSAFDAAELAHVPGAGPQPVDVAAHGEERQALLAGVAALPQNQREVVRLRFQEGLSYREIAGVLELSASNVGYLLHMALKGLRTRLAGDTTIRLRRKLS